MEGVTTDIYRAAYHKYFRPMEKYFTPFLVPHSKKGFSAREMREAIDDTAQKVKPACLRLDFSQVPFMDSSGIGLIMGRYRLMQESGGRLLVRQVPRPLRKVMKVSGLDKLGVLEGTEEAKR